MANRNLSFNPNARAKSKVYLAFALIVAAICAVGFAVVKRPIANAQNQAGQISRASQDFMSKPENEAAKNEAAKNEAAGKRETEFYTALEAILAERQQKIGDLCRADDWLEKRVLEDYGAMFVAAETVLTPPVCRFADAAAVERFQQSTDIASAEIGNVKIELQRAALRALEAAARDAAAENLSITPRDGAEAARRSFDDTLRLWNSRFFPALQHWTERGEISADAAERLKVLPLREQILAVLRLEERRIFFSKDFARSILYSVAAPGCSQHLSMLAFDANEFADERVRQILGNHGWFRTVQGDLPHFTFLGRRESDLPAFGLRRLETTHGEFWIPNVSTNVSPVR